MAQGDGGGQEFVFVNNITEGCPDCECSACRKGQIRESRSSSRDGWKVETLVRDLKEQESDG